MKFILEYKNESNVIYYKDLLGSDEGMDIMRAAKKKYPDYNQNDEHTKKATDMIIKNLLAMTEGEVSTEVKKKLYNMISDGLT